MRKNIGLWIDHHRAVIVRAAAAVDEENTVILSHADRHASRVDGEPVGAPFEKQQQVADDVNDRRFQVHLKRFYDEVAATLKEAGAVFIMGPGEAKIELRKHLDGQLPKGCEIEVEAADKLTDRQVAAAVRDHFHKHSPVTV